MSASDNRLLMQRIFDGLARGDARPFVDSLDEAVVWTMKGANAWSGVYAGKTAIRRDLLAPLFDQFADQYLNVASAIIADGDTVVVESRGGVTTKAGARYENDYCWVFRVRDGKIVTITEYMDTELVTKALTAPPARVEA
jgi:ketosteroid isomerase-like protein